MCVSPSQVADEVAGAAAYPPISHLPGTQQCQILVQGSYHQFNLNLTWDEQYRTFSMFLKFARKHAFCFYNILSLSWLVVWPNFYLPFISTELFTPQWSLTFTSERLAGFIWFVWNTAQFRYMDHLRWQNLMLAANKKVQSRAPALTLQQRSETQLRSLKILRPSTWSLWTPQIM